MFDIAKIRQDFPILSKQVNGHPVIYLDNASTSQKPQQVIDKMSQYYQEYNSNIHRAIHTLGETATKEYEDVRAKVADFIGAKNSEEIIFCRSTTEALNIAAFGWAKKFIDKGEKILLTPMEHHSNWVPWVVLAKQQGWVVETVPVESDGTLDIAKIISKIDKQTKLLTICQMSNVLGTINPIAEIIQQAKSKNNRICVLVDAAQSVPHLPVNVGKLGGDFLAFSAHKMLGPTGVGVLWAKKVLLEKAEPFNLGSDMIKTVSLDGVTWNDVPWKFEAGTPNIAGVIGFGAALDYLGDIGMDNIRKHEMKLTAYCQEQLAKISGLVVYGPKDPNQRGGVISFTLAGAHPHDIATILDQEGIAIRSGHHCAMPLHAILQVPATARASFYLYNKEDEVDALVEALQKVKKIFGV
ncbi:cysteine desulfurase [Candidatus Daviesbacteria bacterium]|nr:cysteine desulfurase [Candidatus Daviesbacteria bacterium]